MHIYYDNILDKWTVYRTSIDGSYFNLFDTWHQALVFAGFDVSKIKQRTTDVFYTNY